MFVSLCSKILLDFIYVFILCCSLFPQQTSVRAQTALQPWRPLWRGRARFKVDVRAEERKKLSELRPRMPNARRWCALKSPPRTGPPVHIRMDGTAGPSLAQPAFSQIPVTGLVSSRRHPEAPGASVTITSWRARVVSVNALTAYCCCCCYCCCGVVVILILVFVFKGR